MAMLFGPFLMLQKLEEEERRNASRSLRRRIRDAQDPFTMTDALFVRNFRLNKIACMDLIENISPFMDAGHYRTKIPCMFRILSALHFFGQGSCQRGVGNNLWASISQPMVSRSIREVANVMIRHCLKRWIKFPRNDMEKNELKERFYMHHRMQHILGVIDGTHIAIVPPLENENIYVNRKGYHSLNVQIICDSNLNIINIISKWAGSTQDSFIWRDSRVGRTLRANYENGDTESMLIGDSGYPCLPWLMVPLPNPVSEEEILFNNSFKRARSTVEMCIGVLKARFRCLLKDRSLHYSPRNAARIVMTCAILHNIAVHYRVQNPQPVWDEIDVNAPQLPQQFLEQPEDVAYRQLGQQRRAEYIQEYY